MTENRPNSSSETANAGVLMQMLSGYWVTQIVRAAVELSLPDHLADGPLAAEDIAEREASDPATTYRLLRACASLGLVAYEGERRFSGTPLSRLLRSGVPNTLREVALTWGGPSHWRAWERFPEAVRKGGTQIESALGTDFFTYLGDNPAEAELFSVAMSGMAERLNGDLTEALDTTGATVAVDVGGGTGALVQGLLLANPDLRGQSLDLPHAAAGAQAAAEKRGVGNRFTAVTGDFFESVPPADLYLLKMVLHDWNDADCVKILENCRASARPGARAVVVENVIGEIGAPGFEPLADMHMLAMLSGQERDLPEFDALFAASGWRRTAVTPTGFQFKIIELEAV
ncbi:methyltransferase [Streptomyces sp. PA03-1a]|nr:methyltransferase [Streptomyces sp. PA03-1a]MDX2817116.1 methyltransferase [Streptomyces sp. PA03-5A]